MTNIITNIVYVVLAGTNAVPVVTCEDYHAESWYFFAGMQVGWYLAAGLFSTFMVTRALTFKDYPGA